MRTIIRHIISVVLVVFVVTSCDEPHDPNAFPMEQFSSYLPYQVGDTVLYDIWTQQGNQKMVQLEKGIPLVVTEITNYYDEGDNYTYTKEYAEYGIKMNSKTEKLDSISLIISLICTGRTRIKVKYTAGILYNHEYPTSITGEYNLAYSSDSLFTVFPKDSVLLENEDVWEMRKKTAGVLKNNQGLLYFYDMMMFVWKLSEK